MNSILVKLKGETREIEFEQPISWSDLPTKRFYLSRNFWIGCFAGSCIAVVYFLNFVPMRDPDSQILMGKNARIALKAHGLNWCPFEQAWLQESGRPHFKRVPSP